MSEKGWGPGGLRPPPDLGDAIMIPARPPPAHHTRSFYTILTVASEPQVYISGKQPYKNSWKGPS